MIILFMKAYIIGSINNSIAIHRDRGDNSPYKKTVKEICQEVMCIMNKQWTYLKSEEESIEKYVCHIAQLSSIK